MLSSTQEAPAPRRGFLITRLDLKILLAAMSGFLCVEILGFSSWFESTGGEWLGGLAFYMMSGAVFGVAILWPYLNRKTDLLWRGAALIAASALSYWCAMLTVAYSTRDVFMAEPRMLDYVAASVVGANLVFIACKFIIPFQWSIRYVLLGLVSGIIGGWLFRAVMLSSHFDERASFIAWQCLVCAALHFGTLSKARLAEACIKNRI